MKQCIKCLEVKDLLLFSPYSPPRKGTHSWCRSCCNEQVKKRHKKRYSEDKTFREAKSYSSSVRYAANKDSMKVNMRRNALKKKYNISLEDYDNMLRSQQGACAICRTLATKSLDVDHDHDSGKVRGLLCWKCNTAIGLLQDNPILARNLAAYLEAN